MLPTSEDCLIFGIGQAHKKENEKIHRYFAYSVCTDSTGAYKKVSILGEGDNETDYLAQLRHRIAAEVQHMSGGYKQCVIHVPFSIRRKEVEAINEALKSGFRDGHISPLDLSVVKVNVSNKYFGYAATNSLVPYAGSLVCLSPSDGSYLVWFDGLQENREIIQRRIGAPVHIQWSWSSRELTADDRRRMLQDLLNLSGANWRSFNARSVPVSIYYCELIAKFAKHCSEIIEHISRFDGPWFL